MLALALTLGASTASARPIGSRPTEPVPVHKTHPKSPHSTPKTKPPASSKPKESSPPAPPAGAGAGSAASKEDGNESASSGEGDLLHSNGLRSPLCNHLGELPPSAQANCATSGFPAAPAPTANYAFDVHIDTGTFNWSGDFYSGVEDVMEFSWSVLVWAVHGVLTWLEWCYSLNLLGGKILSELTTGLHQARISFTKPWLAIVLTIASVLALYHGLIRRRVAETVGQALMMLAMMIGGLWVIVNPAGSIGALGEWSNQASLATLGAIAGGTPDHPDSTLAQDMQDVFSDVITGPWCYMEFGNVPWCRAKAEKNIATVGGEIAKAEQKESKCKSLCPRGASSRSKALAASAALLRGARTNGEFFLALPANQDGRNSIQEHEPSSLLYILCGGKSTKEREKTEEEGELEGGLDATKCHGRTAAEAEYRTQKGAESRAIGLVLVWLGALGMLVLFLFLIFKLLEAALISLFYLMLAPAAVLAPALGDGGRSAFRGWATRLLSAVVAKLTYSFLLGAVLMVMHLLSGVGSLGWWTQWFLIALFWWIAIFHRKKILNFAHGGAPAQAGHGVGGMRLASRLMAARELGRAAGWTRRKLSPGPPNAEKRQRVAAVARKKAQSVTDNQTGQALDRDYQEAASSTNPSAQTRADVASDQKKLDRVRAQQQIYQASGNKRGAAKLGIRAKALEASIASGQRDLSNAGRAVTEGNKAKRDSGRTYNQSQLSERGRFYDAQAALPDKRRANAQGQSRDYRGMAGLAGLGSQQYDNLSAPQRRKADLAIDRQLALRNSASSAAQRVAQRKEDSLKWRQTRKVGRQVDSSIERDMHARGSGLPSNYRRSMRRRIATGRVANALKSERGGTLVAPREGTRAERRQRQFGGPRRP